LSPCGDEQWRATEIEPVSERQVARPHGQRNLAVSTLHHIPLTIHPKMHYVVLPQSYSDQNLLRRPNESTHAVDCAVESSAGAGTPERYSKSTIKLSQSAGNACGNTGHSATRSSWSCTGRSCLQRHGHLQRQGG